MNCAKALSLSLLLAVATTTAAEPTTCNINGEDGTGSVEYYDGFLSPDESKQYVETIEKSAEHPAAEASYNHIKVGASLGNRMKQLLIPSYTPTSNDNDNNDIMLQTRSIYESTRRHVDHYAPDHNGIRKVVEDRVAFVFLTDNESAKFNAGGKSISAVAGRLVTFRGNIVHGTTIKNKHVHLLGPFAVNTFAGVGVYTPLPTPAPVPSSSGVPSGAPSGVPSKAPSLNPSGVPSILPTLSGKPSMAMDPFDESDGGIANVIEFTFIYKTKSTSGTFSLVGECPSREDGIKIIEREGETLCTNTTDAVGNTNPESDFCVVKVTEYECTETTTRKLSGRRLETTYTITAVLELVITTYCTSSGGDTYSGCDPDNIEDINNQIEDAITDLIDDDPDLTLDEIVADLVDDLRRWYPNWSGGSKSECKNDGKYPSYMKRSGVIRSSLKACCGTYYSWEEDKCIANSGGSTADSETGDFYIDWSNIEGNGEGYCVRACLEEDSALDPPLVNCGGINERWETPYETAEKCCKVMETYVNKEYCIAKSEGGPDAPFNPTGSGEWYVAGNDCKKDCTTSDSECEALDLSDTWTVTYDDKDDCCKLLTWLTDDDGNCPAQADYGDDDEDDE